MQTQKQHMFVGYVKPCKIDKAQKNWFEAVNTSLEANHPASMQIFKELH